MTNFVAKSALVAALVFGASSSAFALSTSNTFDIDTNQDIDRVFQIESVDASSNGVISIYDYDNGERGALLGSKSVHAGQQTDVAVVIDNVTSHDVFVVLSVNGQEVYQDTTH